MRIRQLPALLIQGSIVMLYFQRAISLEPVCLQSDEIFPILNQIEELSLRGQLEESAQIAKKALFETNDSSDTHTYLHHKTLWLLFELKQYAEVISTAKNAPEKDVFALLMQAKALKNLNRFFEAEEVLERALNNNEDLRLFTLSGDIKLLQGKTESAKKIYEKAPNDRSVTLKKGLIGVMEKDAELIDKALSILALSSDEKSFEEGAILYLMGKKELLAGNTSKALDTLAKALQTNMPNSLLKPLLFEFGSLSFSMMEDPYMPNIEKEAHFKRGYAAFLELIQKGEKERPLKAIAMGGITLALNGIKFNDTCIIPILKELQTPHFLDLAFILETELTQDFETKESLYKTYNGLHLEEVQGLRCQNLIKWGVFLNHKGFKEESTKRLKEARDCLESLSKKNAGTVFLFAWLTVTTESEKAPALSLLKELPDDDKTRLVYEWLIEFDFKSPERAALLSKKVFELIGQDLHLSQNIEVLFLIATSLFDHGYYAIAQTLLDDSGLNALSPEALFLAASIAEKEDRFEKRTLLKTLIDKYPNHPLNDEAEFIFYSIQEYLTGGRAEIKHLEQYTKTRKDSPYLPLAYYIIGLDFKKDRKDLDGKWVRKKNLTFAIDAFAMVSSSFNHLLENKLIPKMRVDSLRQLEQIAKLDLGSCNLEIAKDSKNTKRGLYLEYAKEVFSSLKDEIEPSALRIDACTNLARVMIELNEIENATLVLQEIIKDKHSSKFALATAHALLSETFIQNKNYHLALDSLDVASSCQEGFSSDETLGLSMKKGLCLKALGKLDEAMAAYSYVVNANAVSSLRIESMFFRAAIYKEQNRYDLYRKQLEAIVKIGGNWKLKAQQLLDQQNDKPR